jgi:hypothetical protein
VARRKPARPDVRRIALNLPQTEEIEAWGNATFRVRNRMFVILRADELTASVKASLEEQAALLSEAPDTFSEASYVGRFGWVTVRLDRVDRSLLVELIADAWASTAPKRLVKEWEAASTGG